MYMQTAKEFRRGGVDYKGFYLTPKSFKGTSCKGPSQFPKGSEPPAVPWQIHPCVILSYCVVFSVLLAVTVVRKRLYTGRPKK